MYMTVLCLLQACVVVGEQPVTRWIVNFDVDLIDGLVIGTCLAAYTPFLVRVMATIINTSSVFCRDCSINESLYFCISLIYLSRPVNGQNE